MISSSDFTCSSSVVGCLSTLSTPRRSAPVVDPPRQRSTEKADLVSASGQFPWPPAGNFVAVYGQDLMAADTLRHRLHRQRVAQVVHPRRRHLVRLAGTRIAERKRADGDASR